MKSSFNFSSLELVDSGLFYSRVSEGTVLFQTRDGTPRNLSQPAEGHFEDAISLSSIDTPATQQPAPGLM